MGENVVLEYFQLNYIINLVNKKQKEEQYKLFADAFHEVVVPLLEDVATKEDLDKVADRLERRLDKIDDRQDRHGRKLEDHERKFEKIESHIGAASF